MKLKNNLLAGALLVFLAGILMGSFLEKSENKLKVIMAGRKREFRLCE